MRTTSRSVLLQRMLLKSRLLQSMLLKSRLLLLVLLAGCITQPPQIAAGTTFIVVRHAEKVPDNSSDPRLSATGEARAKALAASLAGEPLQAVYATAFRRTQLTAAPTAQAHALQVITYDAKQSATQLATQLKQAHPTGAVLVVGHSNSAPDIAAALCACDVPRMQETEYGRRMTIRIAADGSAHLMTTRDP